MKYLQLELLFQFTLHSEKDKLTSVSYNSDCCLTNYETYMQVKITIAKNTMPSALNFKPAYNSNAEQKIVLPISHHMLNQKSKVLNELTPSFIITKAYCINAT